MSEYRVPARFLPGIQKGDRVLLMLTGSLTGFLQIGTAAGWLAAIVVFLVIEGLVPGLISIWFAFGSLAALIAALLRAPMWLQLLWFFLVSVAALCLTRPLAKKYINSKTQPTNADMLIGAECVVKEPIDNLMGTGAVSVGGRIWTARTEEDGITAQPGEIMKVIRIEGVKLIVKK